MKFRDTAVLSIAQGADISDDIETELVFGQSQAAFGLGTIGFAHLRAGRIETASNLQPETEDRVEGGDSPIVMICGPHGFAATRTMAYKGFQKPGRGWGWTGGYSCHKTCLHDS